MKNSFKKVTLFLPLSAVLLAGTIFYSSCSHSEFSEYEKSETGLYYKFHSKGSDTTHPKYGDFIRIKMIIKTKDSTLQNSNDFSPDGMRDMLRQPVFKGGIEEGIRMMAIGDSATFLVNADSINKYYPARDSTKRLAAKSYLEFNFKLMNIQSEKEVMWEEEQNRKKFIEERKAKGPLELSQYIADNHIEQQPTASGLYVIIKEKGTGIIPKDNDTVVVHYTGTLLNGTEFDSSVKRGEPFKFVVNDKGGMSVIPGWNEAVKLMKKGTIASIILPHSLAYDSTGVMNHQTGKYFIPPYSPLKFDIQLLDIKPKK
jgi:FKBP-type peptidyl-prolyl cis-trans isomerase FkpA